VEHALECVARLVRALLGDDAVADGKAEHGASLVILGVLICPEASGFRCRVAPKKAQKCKCVIVSALAAGSMQPGCVRKLAGRLSWATQFLFNRLGRAMLRPLFHHAHSWTDKIGTELNEALLWWLDVLGMDLAEVHPWSACKQSPAFLWVDARGVPVR